jgi:hypothetical protein
MMGGQADEVRALIVAAFANASYPGDDHVVPNPDHCPECQDVATALRGKHWRDLPPPLILEQKDALPLLSPEAFRFFLPAYMLAWMDTETAMGGDSVIMNLKPANKAGSKQVWFEAGDGRLTEAQVQAVRSFLEFVDAKEQRYWDREGLERPENKILRRALSYWQQRSRA